MIHQSPSQPPSLIFEANRFGQIVKAGEPVLSAAVNAIVYGKSPSFAKTICLVPIVGGVAFASLKKGTDGAYALKFDQTALVFF